MFSMRIFTAWVSALTSAIMRKKVLCTVYQINFGNIWASVNLWKGQFSNLQSLHRCFLGVPSFFSKTLYSKYTCWEWEAIEDCMKEVVMYRLPKYISIILCKLYISDSFLSLPWSEDYYNPIAIMQQGKAVFELVGNMLGCTGPEDTEKKGGFLLF